MHDITTDEESAPSRARFLLLEKMFYFVSPSRLFRVFTHNYVQRAWKERRKGEALLDAVRAGDACEVDRLLNDGANVNASTDDGERPLIVAARGQHTEIVRLMLVAGAEYDQVSAIDGCSALHVAARAGNEDLVRVLLTHAGPEPDYRAMVIEALKEGREQPMQPRTLKDLYDADGDSTLCLAAREGHLGVVQQLLDAGASIDDGGRDETPLRIAAYHGRTEVVRALLRAGAAPNLPSCAGWTALQKAAYGGHADVVDLLLAAGAAPGRYGQGGYAPLHHVAGRGIERIARALLASGADVNAKTSDDRTPLHIAVDHGHVAVVRALLEHGAKAHVVDRKGRLPGESPNLTVVAEIRQLLAEARDRVGVTVKSAR